jgi:hypothetical protein
MAHGYLEDGYGTHGEIDPGRREHREHDWRERNWRSGREDWRDRDRDRGIFGERDTWRDREHGSREGYGREHGFGGFQGDYRGGREQGGFGGFGDYSEGRRSFSANPDDHSRSWRDRHMSELDRDYQDYCRERETQFHRDFDDWRRQKYGNPQPLRTGMTGSGLSQDPTGMSQAAEDSAAPTAGEADPTAAATLGTNSGGGRRRG